MNSFNLTQPLLPPHSETIGMRDLKGLMKAHLKQWDSVLSAVYLSELDQAFVAWGLIAIAIFSTAQFSPLSWTTQAMLDAALTGVGIAGTSGLTWQIAHIAQLRWVVFLWATLMTSGMIITAYGIFGGVGLILINLCPLWLGLCAAGYLAMSVGMRSRCFSACAVVHGLAIAGLEIYPGWQFFTSGLVMALTLFFFSVVPWDMRAIEAEEPC
ncbi:MAG: hypothetical protein WBC73_03595 [Phormidesmis sp.]